MRWQGGRQSSNLEDGRGGGGGGVGRVALGGGLGTIVLVVAAFALGIDPSALLSGGGGGGDVPSGAPVTSTPEEEKQVKFVSVILADTEDTWKKIFAQQGQTYQEPKLRLFRGSVRSACGMASAAVGPFYCPADQKAYLDLSFFDELARKFGAPGDFAQAYVIAHEIGHHIQTITGISSRVQRQKQGLSQADANELSVRQELQADCYSGIWAHHAKTERNMLEEGDLEEGLRAATAIGDDTLQRRSGGQVMPESFTHGTSAQRVKWFRIGFKTGDLNACDTFSAPSL